MHILNLVIIGACKEQLIKNMNGSITQAAYFFTNSPKRQIFFEKVISSSSPQGKKKLMNLCRTRWIYRHEAYEVFLQLFPVVFKTLELISSQSQELGQWDWDAESTTMANGPLHVFKARQFLVAFFVVLKVMAWWPSLSYSRSWPSSSGSLSSSRNERSNVCKAYTMVDEVMHTLQNLCNDPTVFGEWYEAIESLAESVNQVITVPRVTGSERQRHRVNYDAQDSKEYYKLSTFNVFIDRVVAQMHDWFNRSTQKQCTKLLLLIPAVTPTLEWDKLEATLEDLANLYQTDLPAPDSHILKDEAERYQRQWSKVDLSLHPSNLREALKLYDKDSYLNLHTLLHIGCILPVTAAESERANSVLKLVKTAL